MAYVLVYVAGFLTPIVLVLAYAALFPPQFRNLAVRLAQEEDLPFSDPPIEDDNSEGWL